MITNLSYQKHHYTIKLVETYLQNKNSAIWLALELIDGLFERLGELDPKDHRYHNIVKLMILNVRNTNMNDDGFYEFPELNDILDEIENNILTDLESVKG